MELNGKSVLVLGGAGLVGRAVCRELLEERPGTLIVASLGQAEVAAAIEELRGDRPGTATRFQGVHGNVLVRAELKDLSRERLLADPALRRAIIDDTLLPLTRPVIERAHLYQVLTGHRPDVIVDCINTATALAYQDIYRSAHDVLKHLDAGHGIETFRDDLERHLCTLYTPQLIRHIQLLYESLLACDARAYVKIGTSGTGGMGLNIPYTHSEERPSRTLLSKSAMAGAHTLLLFLMARTPETPSVTEIKPVAAIAWKRIGYGPVMRGGQPVRLYDCSPAEAVELYDETDMGASRGFRPLDGDDGVLQSVFVDTGENGFFSRAEFEVVTSLGQMEFVTPEEIARLVRFELDGINTGHDVISAMDNACLGPTYRAGLLRHDALEQMERLERRHEVRSVAFEMLGPPRLSKLLFECEILRRLRRTMAAVVEATPEELSREAAELLAGDRRLRAEAVSVGIPVLLPDGRRLLRGPRMVIPSLWDRVPVTPEVADRWAEEGWIDLRPANFHHWQRRMASLLEEIAEQDPDDTSSRPDWPRRYWEKDSEIRIGKVLAWLFIDEERGRRMKS